MSFRLQTKYRKPGLFTISGFVSLTNWMGNPNLSVCRSSLTTSQVFRVFRLKYWNLLWATLWLRTWRQEGEAQPPECPRQLYNWESSRSNSKPEKLEKPCAPPWALKNSTNAKPEFGPFGSVNLLVYKIASRNLWITIMVGYLRFCLVEYLTYKSIHAYFIEYVFKLNCNH